MQQGFVAPIQIHVVYWRVIVGVMKIVLSHSHAEQTTVTLRILHMQTAATTLYQVQYITVRTFFKATVMCFKLFD